MATKYRVVKVKGVNPEKFIVVGIDFAASLITSTSEAMLEADMRAYLQKAGAAETDVNTWLGQARKYPG